MPRARRDQENLSRQKTSRGGKLTTTPPRNLNGTVEPSRFETSTSTKQTTELGTSGFAPLLLGTGIANGTSSQHVENNFTTSQPEITELKSGSNTNTELGHASGLLSSISNDKLDNASGNSFTNHSHRPLSGFLSQWTKKASDTHRSIDPTVHTPSWIQTYQNFGLTKAVAAAQALTDPGNEDFDEKTKQLKDEVTREKASRILVEQLLQEQRQQYVLVQQHLQDTLDAKQDTEEQLQQSVRSIAELEATLATAQQALEIHHNSNETSDWVVERHEIMLTDNVIGVGGWGKVIEGRFRGTVVAVKQIHELILSPHNRRLFEREMNIASRCRHPCLLQFIGATNDDGSPLFVTELLDTSLRTVLQERALEPDETTTIALDVARALNYLHLSRPAPIIHRDISSANVLLWKHGERWRAKVSDYGTANFMQNSMTVGPGAVVYSAPEAHTSRQSPKVDVYSFGVLLCEMNNREFPDVVHRTEQVSMVTNHVFRDLIRRCLLDDPGERPSMAEIIDTLET